MFYIQKGKVKLTVISAAGKEATIGIVGEGNFLGKAHWQVKLFVWVPRQQ